MKRFFCAALIIAFLLISSDAGAVFDSRLYTHGGREYPFDHTIIPDSGRIEYKSLRRYDSCSLLNGKYMFESTKISSAHADNYAAIVTSIAEAVPDARVFNVLFTDSSELYAPKNLITNQLSAIKTVYRRLGGNVTPVDAVSLLTKHMDEKIYFTTDHHWTQRGAYYAYEAFARGAGLELTPLEEYKDREYSLFYGSYAQKLMAEADLSFKPEVLEKIMPNEACSAAVYTDQKMTKKQKTVPVVSRRGGDYTCFIGGDNPLTVIKSSRKNGKKLCILKESFGNVFATWAVGNYEYVYVIDIRGFNGAADNSEKFSIADFYDQVKFDDLIIISYPETIESNSLRQFMAHFTDAKER